MVSAVKTRRPISTISYNTPEYLQGKLEELRKAKIISVWFFIKHKKEADEKKDHIHVYLEPAKQVFTDALQDEFIEPVEGSDKPLKCMHFTASKFGDWYLYSIYDVAYLARKGQTRQYHYKKTDVVVCDEDEFDNMVNEIDMTEFNSMHALSEAVKAGTTFSEFVAQGNVSLQQFLPAKSAYEFLNQSYATFRNGRQTHTPAIDPTTGELVED